MKVVEEMVHTMMSCPNLTTLDLGNFVLYPEHIEDCDRFTVALLSLAKLRKLQMSSVIFGNYLAEDFLGKFSELRHLTLTLPLFLVGKSRPFRRDFNFEKLSVALLKSRLEYANFHYCLTLDEVYSFLGCFKSSTVSHRTASVLTSKTCDKHTVGQWDPDDPDHMKNDNAISETDISTTALTQNQFDDFEQKPSFVIKCLSVSVRSFEDCAEEVEAYFTQSEFQSIANLLVRYKGENGAQEIWFLNGKRIMPVNS